MLNSVEKKYLTYFFIFLGGYYIARILYPNCTEGLRNEPSVGGGDAQSGEAGSDPPCCAQLIGELDCGAGSASADLCPQACAAAAITECTLGWYDDLNPRWSYPASDGCECPEGTVKKLWTAITGIDSAAFTNSWRCESASSPHARTTPCSAEGGWNGCDMNCQKWNLGCNTDDDCCEGIQKCVSPPAGYNDRTTRCDWVDGVPTRIKYPNKIFKIHEPTTPEKIK